MRDASRAGCRGHQAIQTGSNEFAPCPFVSCCVCQKPDPDIMVMKSANDLDVQSRKIMPRGDWFMQLKLNVFL